MTHGHRNLYTCFTGLSQQINKKKLLCCGINRDDEAMKNQSIEENYKQPLITEARVSAFSSSSFFVTTCKHTGIPSNNSGLYAS